MKPRYISPIVVAAVLILVPVVCYYLWARHLSLTYPPYHFAGSGNWVWNHGFNTWLGESYFLPRMSRRFNDWLFNPAGFFLIIAGVIFPAWYSTRRINYTNDNNLTAIWTFHWWLLAFIIYYLIGAKELVANPWNFHILSPAASALIAHALLSFGQLGRARLGRLAMPLVMMTALLLIGLLSQRSLSSMYYSYAQQGYSLGLGLQRVSQPGDLVIVIGNTIGDPISIYYSQRRGWTFPPSDPDRAWDSLPDDDSLSIQWFEELRQRGAKWFGIVSQQEQKLWKNHPDFGRYIKTNFTIEERTSDWKIYNISADIKLTPDKSIKSISIG